MSTLFFKKTSVIDHALLGPNGPKGGSYNLNFTATLPADKFDEEQVVVDFSKGKKEVKELIDRHTMLGPNENGWDHKLWVPTRDTKITHVDAFHIEVEDDFVKVLGPRDAFRMVDCDHAQLEEMPFVEAKMSDYINLHIGTDVVYNVMLDHKPYPDDSISAVVRTLLLEGYTATSMFQYTHGLRASSSYGCNNILHGHLSFVRVTADNRAYAENLAELIASLLDDRYIYHEGIQTEDNVFEYESKMRGYMRLEFKPSPSTQLYIPLSKEPTVENITEWVQNHPFVVAMLNQAPGAVQVQISEGLQKGAMFVNP